MAFDFSEFYKKYEAIINEADQVFNTVRARYSENVRCEKGCSDCCHALFDLTLVEAMRVNAAFNERFKGKDRTRVLKRADEADRLVHRLKRDAFKAVKDGRNAQEILLEMAKVRVRCPLLDDNGLCEMYDVRPVTCRIYGVPTAIGGEAHTCGKSAFEKGKPYPTVYLDRIQDRLYALSHEMASSIPTRFKALGEVLVPLSLALLTDYTDDYLGIKAPKAPAAQGVPAAGKSGGMAARLAAGKAKGKGLAECSGCSPETKQGGCSGCAPKSFTIGQAPERPAKKPAAKKPAAKKPAAAAAKPAAEKKTAAKPAPKATAAKKPAAKKPAAKKAKD